MRRALLPVVLLLVAAFPPVAPASGDGLGVQPARFQFEGLDPGDRREATLRVASGFDETVDVEIEVLGRAGAILRAEPATFRLDPGDAEVVDVEVTVPSDAVPMRYDGLVRVVARGDSGDGTGSDVVHAVGLAVGSSVGDDPVVGLVIEPASKTVSSDARGEVAYAATGVLASGGAYALDAARDVRWTLRPDDAAFDANRVVPPARAGLYAVEAALRVEPSISALAPLRVMPGERATIEIQPAELRLAVGGSAQLQPRAFDAQGNRLGVPSLLWFADDPAILNVNATSGLVTGRAPGTTRVTAEDTVRNLLATGVVKVETSLAPVHRVEIVPGDATVVAGDALDFEAVAYDAASRRLDGYATEWRLRDASVGEISAEGVFSASRTGATAVEAVVGGVRSEADVTVVPGNLVRIQVRPNSATLSAGGSVQFAAVGYDRQGNVVPDAPFAWSVESSTGGEITSGGLYRAGSTTGTSVARVVSGVVRAEVPIYEWISDTSATGDADAIVTQSTADHLLTTTYTVGFSEVDAGGAVDITTPVIAHDGDDTPASLDGGTVAFEDDASDVTLALEIQPGSLSVVPPQIDPMNLAKVVVDEIKAPEPGVFLTVSATENGAPVSSARLNALVDSLDVDFGVPESYFGTFGLDPTRVRMLEYSDGALKRSDIPATLTRPHGLGGRYTYNTFLTDFSAFAFVAEPLPRCVGEFPLLSVPPGEPIAGEPGGDTIHVTGIDVDSEPDGSSLEGTISIHNGWSQDVEATIVVRIVRIEDDAVYALLTMPAVPIAQGDHGYAFDFGALCLRPGDYVLEVELIDVSPPDAPVPPGSFEDELEIVGPGPQPAPDDGGSGGGGGDLPIVDAGGDRDPHGRPTDTSSPVRAVATIAAVRLNGTAAYACPAGNPCRSSSYTIHLEANVFGLDPSRRWTWRWDLGDGTATEEPQPTHTYASRGLYTVGLSVTDGFAVATAHQRILVAPPLDLTIERDGDGWRITFSEPVQRAAVVVGGRLVSVRESPGAVFHVADPGDGSTVILDAVDAVGDVHHVVLPFDAPLVDDAPSRLAPAVAEASAPVRFAPNLVVALAVALSLAWIVLAIARRRDDEEDQPDAPGRTPK